MGRSAALGWGRSLPEGLVTNADLAGPLDTTADAILAETGIARRHWVEPGAGPSDLAVPAAHDALGAAGLGVDDVDLIVFATMTPDIAFPGSGCFLQDKLGCRTVGALDLRAQCAGFVYALATADRFVQSGKAARVLVCTAEVHSTSLERAPRARSVTPRFGDGAGALLVGTGAGRGAIRATALHNDPTGFERFWCEYPSSRHFPARMQREPFEQGRHFPTLDAPALAADAEARLVEVAAEALAIAEVGASEIRLAVVHYLDPRVARRAGERLGVGSDTLVVPTEAFGHVSSAGPTIAVADALGAGRVGSGDLVLVTALGAGIAWGAAVLEL